MSASDAYKEAVKAWMALEDYLANTKTKEFSQMKCGDLDVSMRSKMAVAKDCLRKEDEENKR